MMLPIFDNPDLTTLCEKQRRNQHMLTEMIRDGLPWFETATGDIDFEDVVLAMDRGAIANAIEQCTADEIADFIRTLATIIEDGC